jgi:hypothetical protein
MQNELPIHQQMDMVVSTSASRAVKYSSAVASGRGFGQVCPCGDSKSVCTSDGYGKNRVISRYVE